MPSLIFEICPNFGKKIGCDKMYLNMQIELCGPQEQGEDGECLTEKECNNNIPASAITRKEHIGMLIWENVTFLIEGI